MGAKNLTSTTAIVLHSVASGSRYGFDIMDSTGLPSGTVYPILRRLEGSRLVRAAWEPIHIARQAKRPARKYYEVTSAGRSALEAALDRFPWLGTETAATPRGREPSTA